MTTPKTPPAPAADPAPEPPVPTTAADIIQPAETEHSGGPRAPMAASDAAAQLGKVGAGEPEPPAATPGADPAAIGRASERAKAGFNKHKTKPELIRAGRELAERTARLEAELAGYKGGVTTDGGEGFAPAVVQIDPTALEQPLAEMAGVLSDFLSAWRGDHWQFTEEERTKLGKAGAPVVAELAPALGAHAHKVTLVLVVLGLAMPRLRKDRELAAAAKPA